MRNPIPVFHRALPVAVLVVVCTCLGAANATNLGIKGSQFTINGRQTFLLGISYFSGLDASPETLKHDFDVMHGHGFNSLRVWVDWSYGDEDMSAVNDAGLPREPYMGRLVQLVAECDRRHVIVDVTLSRGPVGRGAGIRDMDAHLVAVRSVIMALASHRNWYLDLGNEHDVGDARHVKPPEVRQLRDLAKSLAPWLKVTASFGAHGLAETDLCEALIDEALDFVAPHRPRNAESPGETERQTRECLTAMKRIGHNAPIIYQEPFRRGYTGWEPKAEDYVTDLHGARAGGAAGWCFHSGATRGAKDGQPRRSFDLRDGPLFDQLDEEERKFMETLVRRRATEAVRIFHYLRDKGLKSDSHPTRGQNHHGLGEAGYLAYSSPSFGAPALCSDSLL